MHKGGEGVCRKFSLVSQLREGKAKKAEDSQKKQEPKHSIQGEDKPIHELTKSKHEDFLTAVLCQLGCPFLQLTKRRAA